jgi:hypothetical protein
MKKSKDVKEELPKMIRVPSYQRVPKTQSVKEGSEYDFNVYQVTFPGIMRNRIAIVLSKDMQSALSTIPQATGITKVSGTIIINKAVAHDICKMMDGKRKV